MPSKFSTIPDERVATDAVARAAVDAALKVPENRPLCEEMLLCAMEREVADDKLYASRAWRRAAIVLAEAPINLFSEEGKKMLRSGEPLGMPSFGTTTDRAYCIVLSAPMKKNLAANPMIAFPPAWRDEMQKDDVRFLTAMRVAWAIVAQKFKLIDRANPLDAIAYTYYIQHSHPVIIMMINIMKRMAGFDEESKFAHIPGLLVAQ
jgi:hypothetical protein